MVPGALKFFDLPDPVAAIAPREVWIVNAVDPLGHRLGISQVKRQNLRALEAFKLLGADGSIRIRDRRDDEQMTRIYREMTNIMPYGQHLS